MSVLNCDLALLMNRKSSVSTSLQSSLIYQAIPADHVPMALLLEADPSEASIARYLEVSQCFAALEGDTVCGVCVVMNKGTKVEIMNVSVWPEQQGRGIGTALLRFTLEQLKQQGVTQVELGTGTFGYQLTYYQRVGFRVVDILKDHFLDNYPKPIIENGIQHKDMLILAISLETE